jgi:hypothetical protein
MKLIKILFVTVALTAIAVNVQAQRAADSEEKTTRKSDDKAAKKAEKQAAKEEKRAAEGDERGERSERANSGAPYYQQTWFISLNGGVHFFQSQRTTFPPLFLQPEITVYKNITVGPQVLMYKYKDYVQYTTDNSHLTGAKTIYPDDKTTYTHMFYGLKAAYHVNDMITKYLKFRMPKELDIYVAGLLGTNSVSVKSDSQFQEATAEAEEERMRGSIMLGAKVIRTNKLGGFVEFGYNDYGYGVFGLSWLISN